MNGSPLMKVANARAHRRLGGSAAAAMGGSDAHVAAAIGGVRTEFCGRTAADLRAAILAGLTRPLLSRGRYLAHCRRTPPGWPGCRYGGAGPGGGASPQRHR
jgi:hypothetical protein